jgi:hypothetical protein
MQAVAVVAVRQLAKVVLEDKAAVAVAQLLKVLEEPPTLVQMELQILEAVAVAEQVILV